MAKVSAITTSVVIDDSTGQGRDISNCIRSMSISTPRGETDITGLDKSGIERQLLLADATLTVNGIVDTGANLSHAVFKTSASSAVARTVVITFPGTKILTMEMVILSYNIERPEGGELPFTAELALSDGTAPAWT